MKCKCGFPCERVPVGGNYRYGREAVWVWLCQNPRGCLHPSQTEERASYAQPA